jgi:hypothetical protein
VEDRCPEQHLDYRTNRSRRRRAGGPIKILLNEYDCGTETDYLLA